MTASPSISINKDLVIPQIGFGTWGLGGRGIQAIRKALEIGYRHLDSADMYNSHEAVAEAIAESGVPREDVFIVTKLWSHSMAEDKVGPAVARFLAELQTNYIDLLLIHWPSRHTPVEETLAAMDAARQAGQVRALGVSNFDVELVQQALDTGIPIANNQIEFNLNHQPQDVVDFCFEHDVTVTAYSPLERGSHVQEAELARLAEKYQASREQVLLNWLIAKGMIVIPRSANLEHIESNYHCLDWQLEAGDANGLVGKH